LYLKKFIQILYFLFFKEDDYEDTHEVIDHAIEQLQKKYGIKYEQMNIQGLSKL
jgi:hypothetical protein